jgi:hypothetical protein
MLPKSINNHPKDHSVRWQYSQYGLNRKYTHFAEEDHISEHYPKVGDNKLKREPTTP